MSYSIIYGSERDDYYEITREIIEQVWPEFMLHDADVNNYWPELMEAQPEYQLAFLDDSAGKVTALGNSFAFHYDGTLEDLPDKGLDWALKKAVDDLHRDVKPNIQCAFQIAIDPNLQGQNLSGEVVKTMTGIGQKKNFKSLIAPVRPNHKWLYPLTPIENYAGWKNGDGLPFDPWIRVHVRLGARIIKPCPESMLIEGSVGEWEEWTGMKFPESGEYIIKGALMPVKIDISNDRGIYIEPNVWMNHPL